MNDKRVTLNNVKFRNANPYSSFGHSIDLIYIKPKYQELLNLIAQLKAVVRKKFIYYYTIEVLKKYSGILLVANRYNKYIQIIRSTSELRSSLV